MARKNTLQIWIEYAVAKSILSLLGAMPRRFAVRAGTIIAHAVYPFLGKLRRVGRRNLELAFPEQSPGEREVTLKAAFAGLGRTLGVVSSFRRVTPGNIGQLIERNFSPQFEAAFEKILAEKRGFIIPTGHIGNWELFALAYSMLVGPSGLLSRRMDNPLIDKMVREMRTRTGNTQIDKTNSARPILSFLRDGKGVGILADVNAHPKEGVFVPFFDIPACTTAGVAMLALRANALIIPFFAVWDNSKQKYVMIADEIIEPISTGDRKRDIERITAQFTAILERVIRKYPDQWIWIHRRWKTRPPGEPELYDNI